uniref:Uncharacterized protein n=1 Tax=Cannabis sativa TaxID=3483 RepID=A0A803PFK2_CANSA
MNAHILLPVEISHDMESLMSKYWWRTSASSNSGIHWMSWERLCYHKSEGGMGFRNLRDFNLAMLGKQGWRLLTNPDSLVARIFKARYYSNGTFLTAEIGSNPSFVWRSILEAQNLVANGIRWCVGDGKNINVLGDPWLPDKLNAWVSSSHPGLANAKVANLFTMDGLSWDLDVLNDLFEPRDKELILQIPVNIASTRDHLVWNGELSGLYSVKSAYKRIQEMKGLPYGMKFV